VDDKRHKIDLAAAMVHELEVTDGELTEAQRRAEARRWAHHYALEDDHRKIPDETVNAIIEAMQYIRTVESSD
jgi:hypothetical protein